MEKEIPRFYKDVFLRAPDDPPTHLFKNTICMADRPQRRALSGEEVDTQRQEKDVLKRVHNIAELLIRWPHLHFDMIDCFDDLKQKNQEDAIALTIDRSELFINSWRHDNIAEQTIPPPSLAAHKNKNAAFIGVGVNQLFAAGLLYRGKENKPNSYTLWVAKLGKSGDPCAYKETEFHFPSYNGIALENGGYHLYVFCKKTLRCLDCVSEEQPVQCWQTNEIANDNAKLANDYLGTIRAGFGRVFLETLDKGVLHFNAATGQLVQTMPSDVIFSAMACSHATMVIGSHRGDLEVYGNRQTDGDGEDKENVGKLERIGEFCYSGGMETKEGTKLNVDPKPVVQLIHQNTKIAFGIGPYFIQEERHPALQGPPRVLKLPIVASGLFADYIVAMTSKGELKMSFFGHQNAIFVRDYAKLIKNDGGVWRHQQEYISGTFAQLTVQLPSGRLLRLHPEKLIPVEKEEEAKKEEESTASE